MWKQTYLNVIYDMCILDSLWNDDGEMVDKLKFNKIVSKLLTMN
jgi:hypothetical protein